MNFGFTEEQNLLKDQVQRFMKEACPMNRVREISTATARLIKRCGSKRPNWAG